MLKKLTLLLVSVPTISLAQFGLGLNTGFGVAGCHTDREAGFHFILKPNYSIKRFDFGISLDASLPPLAKNGFVGAGVFANRRSRMRSESYNYYGINADVVAFSMSSAYSGGIHYGWVKILNKKWDFLFETGVNLGPGKNIQERIAGGNGGVSRKYSYTTVKSLYVFVPITLGVRRVYRKQNPVQQPEPDILEQ